MNIPKQKAKTIFQYIFWKIVYAVYFMVFKVFLYTFYFEICLDFYKMDYVRADTENFE